MDINDMGMLAGLGGIGAGLGGLFMGGDDPSRSAMKWINKIPGEAHNLLDPWANYGRDLTQDPGGRINKIGQSYQQSPGFQFALRQALQGAGHAAAAGGMAGSPQHEMENMGIATQLSNQDYNNWMQNAIGLHNLGFTQGQTASTNILDQIAQAMAQKGAYSYQGKAAQNAGRGSAIGNLIGGAGALAAFL